MTPCWAHPVRNRHHTAHDATRTGDFDQVVVPAAGKHVVLTRAAFGVGNATQNARCDIAEGIRANRVRPTCAALCTQAQHHTRVRQHFTTECLIQEWSQAPGVNSRTRQGGEA